MIMLRATPPWQQTPARELAIVTPHSSVTDNEGRCPGGGFRTRSQSAGYAHRSRPG